MANKYKYFWVFQFHSENIKFWNILYVVLERVGHVLSTYSKIDDKMYFHVS